MSEPIKNPDGLYTTGEIAKLCGVSVRTVQYSDTRGILIPSSLTEGGRRLYTMHHVGYAMPAHAGAHIVSKLLFLLIL
jgi:hypothetical protein